MFDMFARETLAVVVCLLLVGVAGASTAVPTIIFPKYGLSKTELAVLINDNDAQSIEVANYYIAARQIPLANVVHLNFTVTERLSETEFSGVYAHMNEQLEGRTDKKKYRRWH